MQKSSILLILLVSFIMTNLSSNNYVPTKSVCEKDTLHGYVIEDNYQWLEDSANPEVIEWTQKQNEYTSKFLDQFSQSKIIEERLNELYDYDDETLHDRPINSDREFYKKTKKGQEKYAVYCKDKDEPEIKLLDPNEWTNDEILSYWDYSRNGRYLAVGKSKAGDENPVVSILDIDSNKYLEDKLAGWKQRLNTWLPDNSGFYYTAKPLKGTVPEGDEYYYQSVYLHKLGDSPEKDKKVFSSDNPNHYHWARVSEDGKYVLFGRSMNNSLTEIYYKKIDENAIKPLITYGDASYYATIFNDNIYIQTNYNAPNKVIYKTDFDHLKREDWKIIIPESADPLSYASFVNGKMYVKYKHNAFTKIDIHDMDGNFLRELKLPSIGSASVNGYYSRDEVDVYFSSFAIPSRTYSYDYDSDKLTLLKDSKIQMNTDEVESKQVWYKSKDGTPISMFLIYKKGLILDGNNPVELYGYGGFNNSQTPGFNPLTVMWIESGGVKAIPNLRGGGEYGKAWHEAGKRENKQNTFDDFIAAAEWLIDNKYTNPEKIAIHGGSNGGLLVGAVAMQRPDLFKTVLCSVPLLDMIRFHKFSIAKLWIDEYGNPDIKEEFEYIRKYSPYHNIKPDVEYPSMLITASANDARVDPLHAKKMVAALQNIYPDGNKILLKLRHKSGHGGSASLKDNLRKIARDRAFIMSELGMEIEENIK